MKLLFNATMIASEGGVTLLLNYIEHFLQWRSDLALLLYVNPGISGRVREAFAGEARLEIVAFQPSGFFRRFWWEQVQLPGLLRKQDADTLFSYGNTGPLFPGCRQVLYVQQGLPYSVFRPKQNQLTAFLHRWIFRIAIALAQFGSAKIVTQTRWMVHPLRRSVGLLIPEKRYVVSPPGLPETDETPDAGMLASHEKEMLNAVDERRQADHALLFYPAFLAPYKRIPYLLEAFRILRARTEKPVTLVLTFDRDSVEYSPCKKEIFDCIDRLPPEDRPLLTGTLSRNAIQAIYRQTDLLVYPSQVESLGMPLLEALAHEIPVVACDQPEDFARELCGNAALYASPENPADFADQISRLLNDRALYTQLQANARIRKSHFSWPAHIAALLGETSA